MAQRRSRISRVFRGARRLASRFRKSRYKRTRTVTRPRETWHCHWRPRRRVPRTFGPRDAGRIICLVQRQGFSRAQIEKEANLICPEREPKSQAAEEFAVNVAFGIIDANNAALLDHYRLFLIINGILAALIIALGIIQLLGPLRLIGLPTRAAARLAQIEVAKQITINIRQRAANDESYKQLLRKIEEFAKAA